MPAAKRIFTTLCHCTRAQQSPRQPILETDLALLQGWVLGAFRYDQLTLGPKLSVARSQVTDDSAVVEISRFKNTTFLPYIWMAGAGGWPKRVAKTLLGAREI